MADREEQRWVTKVEVRPTEGEGKRVLATGEFVIAGAFAVKFLIVPSKDGKPRLSLPASPNKRFDPNREEDKTNRRYYDEAHPVSKEYREELENLIFAEYRKVQSGGPQKAAIHDDIPF